MLDQDYYQRRFLQLAERSVELGYAQALTLSGIGSSMAWLISEVNELRHTHTAALALQQEILHRKVLQVNLEEFIYQLRKVIASFLDPSDLCPPVSRALLTRGLLLSIKNSGISTSVIRGIENKEAFDKCLDDAKNLYRQLCHDPEVRKAIAREEATERKQLEEDKRRLKAEEARRIEEARRNAPATLHFFRSATATCCLYNVHVAVDGELRGKLDCDESLTLQVRPGDHLIEVSCGWGPGSKNSMRLSVTPSERLSLETYVSNRGIFGGRLKLKLANV